MPALGPWIMLMDIHGRTLPINFSLDRSDSSWFMTVTNSTERIRVSDIELHGDSIRIRMPLFDSEFKGTLQNDSLMVGQWYNYLKGTDHAIPFTATAGNQGRFSEGVAPVSNLTGTWQTHFSPGTTDAYNAIGEFEQVANGVVQGTFLTETGDYRFLEGRFVGDSLKLSAFDGSHAFLFLARLHNDTLRGLFMSGIHWQEPWIAVRDSDYQLRDPDSLTSLREGYSKASFRFPDTEGRMVSSDDPDFKGKPMMVQVMGSWCPNCVDETRLLNDVHSRYHDRGLRIISIAFEKYEKREQALRALQRFRTALDVPYPILYGGRASKEEAGGKLPFLDHLMSYPTCIFIDKNGLVRRIRTGFYGPGTGSHYEHYRRSLDSYIESLLNE